MAALRLGKSQRLEHLGGDVDVHSVIKCDRRIPFFLQRFPFSDVRLIRVQADELIDLHADFCV